MHRHCLYVTTSLKGFKKKLSIWPKNVKNENSSKCLPCYSAIVTPSPTSLINPSMHVSVTSNSDDTSDSNDVTTAAYVNSGLIKP